VRRLFAFTRRNVRQVGASTGWSLGLTCAGHRKKIEANRQRQGYDKVTEVCRLVQYGHAKQHKFHGKRTEGVTSYHFSSSGAVIVAKFVGQARWN